MKYAVLSAVTAALLFTSVIHERPQTGYSHTYVQRYHERAASVVPTPTKTPDAKTGCFTKLLNSLIKARLFQKVGWCGNGCTCSVGIDKSSQGMANDLFHLR